MQQRNTAFAEAIRRRAESPDNLEYLVQRSITALQLTKEQVLDLIAPLISFLTFSQTAV